MREGLKMAGTRTAPLVTAAATYQMLSISFVDASGDVWSESLRVPTAVTAAEMEALVADIQERSNASIFKIETTAVREGTAAKSNATTDPRSQSVFDHVFLTFKNLATGMAQRIYIPAPLEATLVDESDTPNNTDLADVATTGLIVLGSGYAWRSSRYTETREINAAEKP